MSQLTPEGKLKAAFDLCYQIRSDGKHQVHLHSWRSSIYHTDLYII